MILYLEASAAAKLLVDEAESVALAAHLDAEVGRGGRVVSCVLLETELRRLAVRVDLSQSAVTELLEGVDVAELERAEFRTAGLLTGAQLRSLDALHVASALRWQADAVVTYDHRQADAVEAAGIRVLVPR
ncbi:type II toxin-antitoxin system VapC family toxin [Rhodococcus antarcticus]|uniref:Ribonuclease VapC n=1 Tax=Rhodococcus antarcticus TaxID=2987751 RepID=A0ABY6NZN3_9NOCA|nr:type II toxin-antitoxin system VapC family toxin [Rhodococcus antarcticus]UZJ24865.1 type II toxin-antitoxin system VapC family toxin [Rhodococcus antarcticus]